MDILCVGMLRSCSTWQYEVASHLVERHRKGLRLGYLEGPDYARQPVARKETWRVTKAHYRHEIFEQRIADGTALPIYAYRDVRDVVFSMVHKFGLSFEELLSSGKLHALLEDDRFWRSQPGILIQRYEEIVVSPVESVEQLGRFLNIEFAPGEAERVASEYSFESNLKRTSALTRRLESEGVDLSNVHNAVRHDPKTLLHWNHLRTGRVGAWKEQATTLQRRQMADLFDSWLTQNGYERDDIPPASEVEAVESQLLQRAPVATPPTVVTPIREWTPPFRASLVDRIRTRLPRRLSRWLSALRVQTGS